MKKAALGLVAILALTACSSSKKTSAGTSSTSPSHSASASASSLMSKKDFAAQANLICQDADKALTSLPKPSSDTDYPAYVLLLEGTRRATDTYRTAMDTAIAQAADQTELRAKWYSIETADMTATNRLIDAAVLAAQHADAPAFATAIKAYDAAPNHTADYKAYITAYGMTDCAKLPV